MLGMAFGAGLALGGLAGAIDPRLPFFIAGALSLANAMSGLLVLPESLAPADRAPFSWWRANPLGGLALLRTAPQLSGIDGPARPRQCETLSRPETVRRPYRWRQTLSRHRSRFGVTSTHIRETHRQRCSRRKSSCPR